MVKNKVSKVFFNAVKVALLCGASLQFVQPIMAMEDEKNNYVPYKVEEKKLTKKEVEENIQFIKSLNLSIEEEKIHINRIMGSLQRGVTNIEEHKLTEEEIEKNIQLIKESDLLEKEKQIAINELEWKKKNLNPVKCVDVHLGQVTNKYGIEFAKMIEKTEGISPKEKLNLIYTLEDNYEKGSKPLSFQSQKNIAEEIEELEKNTSNLTEAGQKHLERLKKVQYLFGNTMTHYTDKQQLIGLTGIDD